MNYRVLLPCLLMLLPCSAVADPAFTHELDAGYATESALGSKADDWSGQLSSLFSYDHPGPNLQFGGRYDYINASGTINLWSANASGFWRDRAGTIGASVGFGSLNAVAGATHVTSYG